MTRGSVIYAVFSIVVIKYMYDFAVQKYQYNVYTPEI